MTPEKETPIPKTVEEMVEKFANIEHERWSKWQQWVFDCSTENEDGSVTIPADKVERWKRQIATPYAELSEKEKQSDRDQVYPYIQALHTSLVAAVEGKRQIKQEHCPECRGDGYTVDYDPSDHTGNTPMQVQCLICEATGIIEIPNLEYNQALDDTLTIINSIFKE